jgi:hypothetical protein
MNAGRSAFWNTAPATARLAIVTTVGLACLAGAVAAQEFSPFVIPAQINPSCAIWVTDYEPISTQSERLTALNGHFRYRGKAIRIWGVNLSFGANLPTQQDAPLVAARLAAAGVNAVRCHHMDSSRWPDGIWNSKDGKSLDPQALDRLDYFINELAKRGIWADINLHVGREHTKYLGLPQTNREYDKIVGIYTPALVDAQKQYARDLLTHVNKYRGVRYADDPAVAFVEITNEDSFFMWDADQTLRTLPPYYAEILRNQFNAWLMQRYGSDEALLAAWAEGTQPLGQNMLQDGNFTQWDPGKPKYWNLEQHEGCRATLSQPRTLRGDAVQVEIGNADTTDWHLQFTQGGFAVSEGRYYTVSFEAASQQPRHITCHVGQAHDPWGQLGFSRQLDLTTEWKSFSFGSVATASDTNARISFAFSGDSTAFNLARIELRPGGQVVLGEGESLAQQGSVNLFAERESPPRIIDRMLFLAQTEKAYFDGMRSYIRGDVGCGALVTGTIVFGPLGLYAQSDMDFIDSHAYWQHPSFPGRPWDPDNWLVEQRPMADHPDQATLFRLAAQRLTGKPFTVSEYNHPAPLDTQAECVPMIASFAAAQDWDGIWLYTYSHSSNSWDRQYMNSYFDIDTNPAKWGFMRAGSAIFRHGGVGPFADTKTVVLADAAGDLRPLAQLHQRYGSDMFSALSARAGVTHQDMMKQRVFSCLVPPCSPGPRESQPPVFDWSVSPQGQGLYRMEGPGAWIYTGHASRFAEGTADRIAVTSPALATVTVTALDSNNISTCLKMLVTACGRCENTGMQFSQDRRTVGRNWGQAPVRIEPVRGITTLPPGEWVCHALAPDGSPKETIPITYENARGTLTLSPDFVTMWYLLDRQTR